MSHLPMDELSRLEDEDIDENDEDDEWLTNAGTGTDDSRSFSGHSRLSSKSFTIGGGDDAQDDLLPPKRSGRSILLLKLAVLSILVLATAAVGATVYVTMRNGAENALGREMESSANRIFSDIKFNVERKLGALDTFALETTSFAMSSGASWPNVTLPNFEYRVHKSKKISGDDVIIMVPVIYHEERAGWEEYTRQNARQWIQDGTKYQEEIYGRKLQQLTMPSFVLGHADQIYSLNETNVLPFVQPNKTVYTPAWQIFPPFTSAINLDLKTTFPDILDAITSSEQAVMGRVWEDGALEVLIRRSFQSLIDAIEIDADAPISFIAYPVFDSFQVKEGRKMVSVIVTLVSSHTFFLNSESNYFGGLYVVLSNACDQAFTWLVNGDEALYLGPGFKHNPRYEYLQKKRSFQEMVNEEEQRTKRFSQVGLNPNYCPYQVTVFPTSDFVNSFDASVAFLYTAGVVAIFAFMILLFLIYDILARSRQSQVTKRVVQSGAIVSSLYPKSVRERLFPSEEFSFHGNEKKDQRKWTPKRKKKKRKSHSEDPDRKEKEAQKKLQRHLENPIADSFANTTVMFSDIAGFTKWSSERDPSHVFMLLETLYSTFDEIAKRRKVFKVETIGDCYVAVTGIPAPQDDHFLRMAKFANECRIKFSEVLAKLRLTLGDDTKDLAMRFGLHSGPVTAGVLRGDRSRFQLFGNTVNIAAEMEHTGQPNRIQVSHDTADLIIAAGKSHWISREESKVPHRGEFLSFWVEPRTYDQERKERQQTAVDGHQRLIKKSKELLQMLIRQHISNRSTSSGSKANKRRSSDTLILKKAGSCPPRDEVVDTIHFPLNHPMKKPLVELEKEVKVELQKLVSMVADMYRRNPFHNFEHAVNLCSHVVKMVQFVKEDAISKRLSHPLTILAVAFSALVHDIDHTGVPNNILTNEQQDLREKNAGKSCAEQHSIDLAWNLLMDSGFEKLREVVFQTDDDLLHFRQIMVNSIMATDIFDPEMKGRRQKRKPLDLVISRTKLNTGTFQKWT